MPSITENRPSAEEWSYEFIDGIIRGLVLSKSPRKVDAGGLLKAKNIRFQQSVILKDLGYVGFGQVVVGRPRVSYEFFKSDGGYFLTLITNSSFYVWNDTDLEWEYVHDGTSTTLSSAASATDTSIEVNDISGFGDGDRIGIRLDNGKQHRTTINGAPAGSTINIDDAMPSAAAIGNAVVRSVHLTGSDDIQPTVTTWAATDRMYFTNGTDAPKYFDGTSVTNISGLPASTKARIILLHINHLVLLHTEEGGTLHPQRERWSEPGSDSSWNTGVNFNDHYDSEDHILGGDLLGVYLIIYKERNIIRQEFVGQADQTWNWITTVQGEGALSADAIINLGGEHLFWGNSNIYRYRGGFDLDPIGDEIFDGVFSTSTGDLNADQKERVFALYIEELDEALFFYPNVANTFPRKAARYNLQGKAWSFREFSFDVLGFGFYSSQASITWDDLVGNWEDWQGPWFSSALSAGAPTILLMDGTNNKVFEYDFLAGDDDGTAISYEIETRDWFIPNIELRFDRYDIRMFGNSVTVEASFDGGDNFVSLGIVSPGTSFIRQRLYKQQVGRSIRFRFTGSGGFGLESIGFLYKHESVQP